MRILAFNPAHDSSICVLNDGKIEFFCKEERISRVKRDKNPFKSLELFASINKEKIDSFIWCNPTNSPNNNSEGEPLYHVYVQKRFNKSFRKFNSIEHHLSHAALAFVNSKFEECLVFVIDRNGSIIYAQNKPLARESESVYLFNRKYGEKPIHKSYWVSSQTNYTSSLKEFIKSYLPEYTNVSIDNEYSIVKVYEAATILIGQHQLESGKTMGLSSYGEDVHNEPLFINDIPIASKFETLPNGEVIFHNMKELIESNLKYENYKFYANKAKQVQQQTQQVVLNLIEKYVEQTGIKNVCLVGGYALNVVANNFYIKNLPGINFYFEPTADDTGTPIGAAMMLYYKKTGKWADPVKDNFYHYYDYEENTNVNIGQTADLNVVVELLLNGKSVAIFEGAPEAGPRALGHRSILFDPRNPDAKEILNKIKKREWYRPFAGVILESEFENYFETLGILNSPYMTINFNAKDLTKQLVSGIIHVDGTCRVQTVNEGFLFNLLNIFNKKTGCPMLLNTSFNLAGEPLVQTKADAIKTFENSELDALFFVDEDKILTKSK